MSSHEVKEIRILQTSGITLQTLSLKFNDLKVHQYFGPQVTTGPMQLIRQLKVCVCGGGLLQSWGGGMHLMSDQRNRVNLQNQFKGTKGGQVLLFSSSIQG